MEGKQLNRNTKRKRRWKIHDKRVNDLVSEVFVVFFFFFTYRLFIYGKIKGMCQKHFEAEEIFLTSIFLHNTGYISDKRAN